MNTFFDGFLWWISVICNLGIAFLINHFLRVNFDVDVPVGMLFIGCCVSDLRVFLSKLLDATKPDDEQ